MKTRTLGILVLSLFLCGGAFAGQAGAEREGGARELTVSSISDYTVRITVGAQGLMAKPGPLAEDLILEPRDWPQPLARIKGTEEQSLALKNLVVKVKSSPLSVVVTLKNGTPVQELSIDANSGAVRFFLGKGSLFGLGGGGLQFDKRGLFDAMDNGHRDGEYNLFGSRVPIPFLIGTDGWALFFHLPYNAAFDLRGSRGRFVPKSRPEIKAESPFPLDVFIIACEKPERALFEFTGLTGRSVMPPKWALGYMQSHRTLEGPEAIVKEAETFRQKQLPCDTMIYLGTGYCPSGWNLGHGSLEFNPTMFDDPPAILNKLHGLNFRVVLHKNNAPISLHGEFPGDGRDTSPDSVANYWARHKQVFVLGIDGWWPDDGDELPIDPRLIRHMIYFKGPLADRPDERPFSLHRTGYAGMQRFGGWVWSGDVYSLWETLAAHVGVALNFSLSASPFWGTDIGGFFCTKDLTGELYVRWFQFGAFCPVFRSHGRVWHLRLPWGWNTGEVGPNEIVPTQLGTGLPDPSELHNAGVEPICKKYMELRYQLMPYLYSAVREAHDSGMPIMRALWLHYPDDPRAVQCGDEYLWGRDMLVVPITQKGVTQRRVYLPQGVWYDFWSNRQLEGGQSLTRYVDLSTMPLYVRAGTILPFAPVRQFVSQPVTEPLTLRVYTGADGRFVLYDDDGQSLQYLSGKAEWISIAWADKERSLVIEREAESGLKGPGTRTLRIVLLPENKTQDVEFTGERKEIKFEGPALRPGNSVTPAEFIKIRSAY